MTTKPDEIKPYRIAARTEGEWVNCYWAKAETMTGAEPIAAVKLELLNDPKLREIWTMVLQAFSIELAKTRLGAVPHRIDIDMPPESEKAGRA